jgi:hypothetical protein
MPLPPRIEPHTNTADAGMPHDSLVQYIDQLEKERDALARQLRSTLEERDTLIEQQ